MYKYLCSQLCLKLSRVRGLLDHFCYHEGVGEMSNHNFLLSSNLYMYTSEIKLGKRALKIILAKYVNYFSQNRQAPVFIIYSQLQNSVIDVLS